MTIDDQAFAGSSGETPPIPRLDVIEELPVSGPFDRRACPRWFPFHDRPADAWMSIGRYERTMIELGTDPDVAGDTVARMRSHGCEHVFWAGANGGRRGHVRASWDVRVATTASAATLAVPAIISLGPIRPGHRELPALQAHPAVLRAESATTTPAEHRGKRPVLGSRFRVTTSVRHEVTHYAFAALAAGQVGATCTAGAGSRAAADAALTTLVELLLQDLDRAGVLTT